MDGIRRASPLDAADLAERLAPADELECRAYGMTPEGALVDMITEAVEVWAAVYHGKVQVVFGVARAVELSDTFTVFLLASSDVPKVRFMKEAFTISAEWREKYKVLRAFVDERNTRAIKWLKRIGFTLGGTVPVGPYRRPFLAVWLVRNPNGMVQEAA